jgi:myosin-crossreactive antigen
VAIPPPVPSHSVITALAALAGAAIGGVMTVFDTQWIAHNLVLRQELYKEFIEQSSKLYTHALQNSNADVSGCARSPVLSAIILLR